MPDRREKEIDNEPVQHTAEHDFQGVLTKDGTDVATVDQTGGDSYEDGQRPVVIGPETTNYADGLTDEEISRFGLQADETLELWRLEVSLKGGGSSENVSVAITEAGGNGLHSVTAGSVTDGGESPIVTLDGETDVLAVISNSTGNAQDVSHHVVGRIV